MSDFLTRMAQRSRGEAAVVSPRLPGLFAPVEDRDSAETAVVALSQQRNATPSAETTHRSGAADDKELQPVPHGQRLKAPPMDSRLPARQAERTADTVRRPRMAPAGNNPAMPGMAAPLADGGRDVPATAPPAPGRTPAPSPLFNDGPQTAAPITIDLPVDSAAGPNKRADPLQTQPPMLLVPGYETGPGTPQEALAELPTAVEQSAGQGPTVHINIGRVEVRARTAAPATAPRPARSGPQSSLSLKDYLSRDGDRP